MDNQRRIRASAPGHATTKPTTSSQNSRGAPAPASNVQTKRGTNVPVMNQQVTNRQATNPVAKQQGTSQTASNKPAPKKQEAIVICGFAAIGKSTFIEKACEVRHDSGNNKPRYFCNDYEVIDHDSSLYKGPTREEDYLESIREKMHQKCVLMISTHQKIYTQLLQEGFNIVLVYPKRELQAQWLERIRLRERAKRTSPQASILSAVGRNWGDWIDDYEKKYELYKFRQRCQRYQMSEHEYLQDAADKIPRLNTLFRGTR